MSSTKCVKVNRGNRTKEGYVSGEWKCVRAEVRKCVYVCARTYLCKRELCIRVVNFVNGDLALLNLRGSSDHIYSVIVTRFTRGCDFMRVTTHTCTRNATLHIKIYDVT